MSGIGFMLDKRERKTTAVIDLRQHGRAWEDFYGGLLADSRTHEPHESLETVQRRLKLKRRRDQKWIDEALASGPATPLTVREMDAIRNRVLRRKSV